METHIWGDDIAGKVKDWIYVSNLSLHQIIFGMGPRGILNIQINIGLYLALMNYYMFYREY